MAVPKKKKSFYKSKIRFNILKNKYINFYNFIVCVYCYTLNKVNLGCNKCSHHFPVWRQKRKNLKKMNNKSKG